MKRETTVIDLSNKQLLNELYTQFAADVGALLIDLYHAGINVPFNVRGSSSEIESFMKTLQGEKRYMDSYMNHGLNDSRTMMSKHDLERAIRGFESETGLRWPFKN